MATLKDLFDARQTAITVQRMFLLQQRELNQLQMEKLAAMEQELTKDMQAAADEADRIELGYGK